MILLYALVKIRWNLAAFGLLRKTAGKGYCKNREFAEYQHLPYYPRRGGVKKSKGGAACKAAPGI
jgi:hypothetical protein